jgi:hypothetical protein
VTLLLDGLIALIQPPMVVEAAEDSARSGKK